MLSDIQKLRDLTGAGVVECQKALKEAGDDFDKAVLIIREKGFARAEKRKGRETGAGLLESYVHNDRVGVLLEIRTETDFAARSDTVKELARNLAMQIAAMAPADIDELLGQVYIRDEALKVDDVVKQALSKVGENIKIERFCRYEI